MTIRRKLSLSFGVILVLFGVNLTIYFWSATQRNRTVDALGRAIERQTLIATISQKLDNLHKQVTLLKGITVESGTACAQTCRTAKVPESRRRSRAATRSTSRNSHRPSLQACSPTPPACNPSARTESV